MLSLNARSLRGKVAEIESLAVDYDIICITETHLDNNFFNSQLFMSQDKVIYRRDRNLYGGGVLVAIKASIPHREIACDSGAEVVSICFKLCGDEYCNLTCYYRPPSNNDLNSFLSYIDTIKSLHPTNKTLITGDFNLPGINWNKVELSTSWRPFYIDFINLLAEHNLEQLIHEPTHIAGNTLDLLCTDLAFKIENVSVIQPGISDHFMIEAKILATQTEKSKSLRPPVKLFHKVDFAQFSDDLDLVYTEIKDQINQGADMNTLWSTFTTGLHNAVDSHVPTRKCTIKNDNEPLWFNSMARRACNKQRKLYSLYKKTKDLSMMAKYKNLRRSNKNMFKALKKSYMTNRLYKPLSCGNSKPFYRYVKDLKGNSNQIMSMEKANGALTQDSVDIANTLNNFFNSVFTKSSPLPNLPSVDSAVDIQIDKEGVINLLKSLKSGKAPGPDKITQEYLSINLDKTADILVCIFNQSLQTGALPDEWKLAHVTPIYKQGGRSSPSNYRPVSLTCICCKLLEHIVHHHLSKQLDEILHENQHGFRKGLSCVTQLATVTHDILKSIEKGVSVHAIVLDFSKAFDVVDHQLLLSKMIKLKINPIIIRWVSSFLSERYQRVILNGENSDLTAVTSGVPQGSVLGPALFILFINDIVDCVSNSTIRLFADDTLIYHPITGPGEQAELQDDLNSLTSWAKINKMRFNAGKSNFISFGDKTLNAYIYKLDKSVLNACTTIKYLGVIISQDMKWHHHITAVYTKALRILGLLKHSLYSAPQKIKLLAYKTICRPLLEYAAEVWDPVTKSHSTQLENIQSKAIRFVKNIKGRDISVTDSKVEAGLTSLQKRRQLQRISLFCRVTTDNYLLPSFEDTLNFMQSSTHSMSTRTQGYNATACESSLFLQSFLVRTAREIRTGEILDDF